MKVLEMKIKQDITDIFVNVTQGINVSAYHFFLFLTTTKIKIIKNDFHPYPCHIQRNRVKERQTVTETEVKSKTKVSVPGCVVGPSQQQVILGWSRPVPVISSELSEATTCAAAEKQSDEGIREKNI